MPPKRTREEIQAELDALDDADDDADEGSITSKDGHTFSGSMRRVREVADAWGIKLKADPPAEPKDPKAAAEAKRFAGRRIS